MKRFFSIFFSFILFNIIAVNAAQINVSTVAELRTAITNAVAGDVILVSGGTYVFTAKLEIKNKVGTASNKFTLMADPNSSTRPKFDFSAMPENSSNQGVVLNGSSYWLFKGIDIYKAGDNGMEIKGSNNNIIEFCTFSECFDSGLQIDGGSAGNLILNCDSYYNADSGIENADGFACKLDVGTGNIFRGCRSWQNLDDGWDGYLRGTNNITTYYENCWSFENGKLKTGVVSGGDGNGFKTGGSDTKDLKHNAVYKNCIAAGNIKKGFDHNSNRGEVTLFNCSATGNNTNMGFGSSNPLSKLTIKNTLAFGSTGSVVADVVDLTNDSWNVTPTITVSNADFQSVAIAELKGARKADGSLPDINYLRPKPTSALINRGVDVGLPYKGTAPDIGAFEYDPTLPLHLLSFNAKIESSQSNAVKILWTTTNEVNTKDFEILRKGEIGDFVKIHTEIAANVAGVNQYFFIDKAPLNGNSYYQLKQNDKDAAFSFSEIEFVKIGLTQTKKLSFYPNPVNTIINVVHGLSAGQSSIKIADTNGKVWINYIVNANQAESAINVSCLIPGVYIVTYTANNQEQAIKIIKQ